MAYVLGRDAIVAIYPEATPGVPQNGKDFWRVPFVSGVPDSYQDLLDDDQDVIGQGRDGTSDATQGSFNVDGPLKLPIDFRYIGFFLTGLMGSSTTTDTAAPYTHTFLSGADQLQTFNIVVGHPKKPKYILMTYMVIDSMTFDFQKEGTAYVTFETMGQDAITSTTPPWGSLQDLSLNRASQPNVLIKSGGADLGKVLNGSLTYSNNHEKDESIRSDNRVAGFYPGLTTITMQITARYDNDTLKNAAEGGTPIDIEIGYRLSDDLKWVNRLHRVFLPKTKSIIGGPGGIDTPYDIKVRKDPDTGVKMTSDLTNDLTGAEYTTT